MANEHSIDELADQLSAKDAEIERLKQEIEDERHRHNELAAALAARDRVFSSFLDEHPVGIFVVDATGCPYYANKASARLLGKGIQPGITKDDLAKVYRVYRADTMTECPTEQLPIVRALAGEEVHIDDIVIFHPKRTIPIEVWASPVLGEDGNVEYAIAAFTDITDRRKADAQIASQTKEIETFSYRLKQIHSLNARPYSDLQALYEEFLSVGLDVFGLETGILSNVVGDRYEVLALRTDIEGLETGQVFELGHTYCEAVLRKRGTVAYSNVGRIRSMRGHPVYQNLKLESYISTPVYMAGEIVGTLNFSSREPRVNGFEAHDFEIIELIADSLSHFRELERVDNERREAWSELEQTVRELERSNQELDDFAYIASHDLKEPLRGISNYARFLKEDYGELLDGEGLARVETMQNLSLRMEDLINSLLYFSRVGRTDLSVEKTSLDALVKDVVETLGIVLQEHGVDVRIPEGLPTISCDAVRVQEVFRNLITNAVKYNDKSDKWIEIGFEEAGTGRRFYVRDNGIGIPEKHRDSVFRIFKRLHGRDKFGGGTGAGLTIAKKIVERHGGQMWFESEPGSGSTFFFTLFPPKTNAVEPANPGSRG